MPSASEARKRRAGGEGGELLKGSSFPKGKDKVKFIITEVRESPEEFRSPLICEIEETFGCSSWAPNATAIKVLEEEVSDDYAKWVGHEVTLVTIRTTNPQTRKPAIGLAIDKVEKAKRKARLSGKDDVPF